MITEDLRWLLVCEAPGLLTATSRSELDDAELAARTAAGLLTYHTAMAQDSPRRWQHLAAIRDAMMADNLSALANHEADRGPTLVFAHNQHLRTGPTWMSLGPMDLRWQPAGAHLAARLRANYMVIGTAIGEAAHLDIPEPEPDTIEGALYTLPAGNHLLPAKALHTSRSGRKTRTTGNPSYFAIDESVLDELGAVLFLRNITSGDTDASG